MNELRFEVPKTTEKDFLTILERERKSKRMCTIVRKNIKNKKMKW